MQAIAESGVGASASLSRTKRESACPDSLYMLIAPYHHHGALCRPIRGSATPSPRLISSSVEPPTYCSWLRSQSTATRMRVFSVIRSPPRDALRRLTRRASDARESTWSPLRRASLRSSARYFGTRGAGVMASSRLCSLAAGSTVAPPPLPGLLSGTASRPSNVHLIEVTEQLASHSPVVTLGVAAPAQSEPAYRDAEQRGRSVRLVLPDHAVEHGDSSPRQRSAGLLGLTSAPGVHPREQYSVRYARGAYLLAYRVDEGHDVHRRRRAGEHHVVRSPYHHPQGLRPQGRLCVHQHYVVASDLSHAPEHPRIRFLHDVGHPLPLRVLHPPRRRLLRVRVHNQHSHRLFKNPG